MIECAFFGREKKIPTSRRGPGMPGCMAEPSTGRQGLKPGLDGRSNKVEWGVSMPIICDYWIGMLSMSRTSSSKSSSSTLSSPQSTWGSSNS